MEVMTTVADMASNIAEVTRPELAADWDPVGIQLGDPRARVAAVAVCHEVTEDVVEAVEATKVDLVVTYHPLLFAKTNRVLAGRSAEARAFRMIQAGVALIVTHTDFDAAPGGVADCLADLFDLLSVEPFGADPASGVPPIGRVGEFDQSLAALDARASDVFGFSGLRVSGDKDTHLERVAVVPGSGGSFVEQAAEAADALVTGDVSHHATVRAADLGLCVVDPGHVATERPGMAALVELVEAASGADLIDLTSYDPKTWV